MEYASHNLDKNFKLLCLKIGTKIFARLFYDPSTFGPVNFYIGRSNFTTGQECSLSKSMVIVFICAIVTI